MNEIDYLVTLLWRVWGRVANTHKKEKERNYHRELPMSTERNRLPDTRGIYNSRQTYPKRTLAMTYYSEDVKI